LNVDQALADLAYFIDTKKKEKNLENNIVIVFGGSYAGNMAAWARLKYPYLIQVFALSFYFIYLYLYLKKMEREENRKEFCSQGALASSAPIQIKVYYGKLLDRQIIPKNIL